MEISEQTVQKQLTDLLTEYGDLDAAIDALQQATSPKFNDLRQRSFIWKIRFRSFAAGSRRT